MDEISFRRGFPPIIKALYSGFNKVTYLSKLSYMKNIIVPVDFSECSLKTAQYSLRLFGDHPDVRLVLYYLYHPPETEETANGAFASIRYGLEPALAERIETHVERGQNFPDAVCRYAHQINASLIVTCFSHKALKLVENNPCPVLIIPLDHECRPIRTVAISSDFHDVERNTPVAAIRDILDLFHPALHIVNVNSDLYIEIDEQYKEQQDKLAALFSAYKPEFDFLSMYDFKDSMVMFEQDKQIDLIITIPHHHHLVTSLFHKHHSLSLFVNSPIPVLAAH